MMAHHRRQRGENGAPRRNLLAKAAFFRNRKWFHSTLLLTFLLVLNYCRLHIICLRSGDNGNKNMDILFQQEFISPSRGSFLRDPITLLQSNDALVVVLSAAANRIRREIIRETWWQDLGGDSGWDGVFLVGATNDSEVLQESTHHKDIWFGSDPDMYASPTIFLRIMMALGKSSKRNYNWVLKVDDDSMMNVPYWTDWISQREPKKVYSGLVQPKMRRIKDPHDLNYEGAWPLKYYLPYSSGFGYILSQDVIQCFISHANIKPFHVLNHEDVMMGVMAHLCEIKPVDNPDIKLYNSGEKPSLSAVVGNVHNRMAMQCLWKAVHGEKCPFVRCGEHYAQDCSSCPEDNGADWCNGDCKWNWVTSACIPKAIPKPSQKDYDMAASSSAFSEPCPFIPPSTTSQHNGGWYYNLELIATHHVSFDVGFGNALAEYIEGGSVLDLGAGVGQLGTFLRKFKKSSEIKWFGYDGGNNIEQMKGLHAPVMGDDLHIIPPICWIDASQPITDMEPKDWVVSIEVGEQIDKAFEDTFIDNLVKLSRKGVVLSWAVEGQGGHQHINCQNNEHVIKQMASRGMVYDEKQSHVFRKSVSELGWLKNTLMVFHHSSGPEVESDYRQHHKNLLPSYSCRPHVVMSTFKCPHCDDLRHTIEDNVLHSFSSLDPSRLAFFVPSLNLLKLNKYGVPLLSSIFNTAIKSCPSALTFTYVNGDILPNVDFLHTIEAVSSIMAKEARDFLMVGRRTDVNWTQAASTRSKDFDFYNHLRRGNLFTEDAIDYFVVTKNAIEWDNIPPFVIGRPAYDNWLLNHVYHKEKVALIDATKTISIIHQVDGHGEYAHGGDMVQSSKDKSYNIRLAKGEIAHGTTSQARFETEWLDGKVALLDRHTHRAVTSDTYVINGHIDKASSISLQSFVSCGEHHARDCNSCPHGHGADWCKGDCNWNSHTRTCMALPEDAGKGTVAMPARLNMGEKQFQGDLTGTKKALDLIHVAPEPKVGPKILCYILTTSEHHSGRIKVVRETWGKKCDRLFIASNQTDESVGAVEIPNTMHDYDHLWMKHRETLRYLTTHNISGEYDWLFKADTDSYIIMENLRSYLMRPEIATLKDKRSLLLGHRLSLPLESDENRFIPHHLEKQFRSLSPEGKWTYCSGGAGYAMNQLFVENLVNNLDTVLCLNHKPTVPEDMAIAFCQIWDAGVPMDTSDDHGLERFHPMSPSDVFHFDINDKNNWLNMYHGGMKKGISSETISFHYVNESQMKYIHGTFYHREKKSESDLLEQARAIHSKNGVVNLVFLNQGYVEMTKSWICNVDQLQGAILLKTLFVATDEEAYTELEAFQADLNIVFEPLAIPSSVSYGQVAYYEFMQFRAKLILILLQKKLTVWVTESDSVWFQDPTEEVLSTLGDMVVTSDTGEVGVMPEGGFILLRPESATISVWKRLLQEMDKRLKPLMGGGSRDIGDGANDQLILESIMQQTPDLKIGWLDPTKFSPGLWYKDKEFRQKHRHPWVLQNNWAVGNDIKVKRAKKWNHWFLSKLGDSCLPSVDTTSLNTADIHPGPGSVKFVVHNSLGGRLGNQLFEHAATLALAKKTGKQACVAGGSVDLIDDYFVGEHFFRNCSAVMVGPYKSISQVGYAIHTPIPKTDKSVHLGGYFQSWKYFSGAEAEIKRAFTLKPEYLKKADEILGGGSFVNVGIHLRWFDMHNSYLVDPPERFFHVAMDHFTNKYGRNKVRFYIASNNVERAQRLEVFKTDPERVVFLKGTSTAVDFATLKKCDGMILSVGSFGWWAAWLGPHQKGGEVIYYDTAKSLT